MLKNITLTRPEPEEELRIEAESKATAGVYAFTGSNRFTWSVQKDPDAGTIFVLRDGDYCQAVPAPELTGDSESDALVVARRWSKLEGRLERGVRVS